MHSSWHWVIAIITSMVITSCVIAFFFASFRFPRLDKLPSARSAQRLDEAPRANSKQSVSGTRYEWENRLASQHRRDDDGPLQSKVNSNSSAGSHSVLSVARDLLERIHAANRSDIKSILNSAPLDVKTLCEMELFTHHYEVDDDIRERVVRAVGLPEVSERFQIYQNQSAFADAAKTFDRFLAVYALRYIEKTRRELLARKDDRADRLRPTGRW
jgi:hypothetical protein